ncbi:zinc dependent phospholipase C family protein [Effusibacillus pohliae]|uniref:zinc dependent phospholipase C family protein n=1 Tax=Effusibacillus pohliae TaxID=232270 RepID=UPI000381F142|nr:zinc dependent phospholipase C family protein [Effusibacillus pohliae]
MPNIWTHLIFGREVLRTIGRADLAAGETINVFHLGCQGPDFLFYHNFLPWQKDTRLNELGQAIHLRHCGPFLLELVRTVRGRPLQDPAVIYMLGFLTHHVLDRNMHPYIHYKAGYARWNHQRLEVILDTLFAKKYLTVDTSTTPVWRQFYTGRDLPTDVARMLQWAAAKFFPELAGGIREADWVDAYRDMVRAWQIFHDPTGIKRILTCGRIDPFVYKRRIAPLDYLNEAKQVWHHPAALEESRTDSVWELWEQALADGAAVLQAVVECLEQACATGESPSEARLAEAIGNLSYDTGKPCDSGLEPRYANPLF